MFNREVFSSRLKLLRIKHELSMLNLSTLLNLKSSGSVSNFETKKMSPSSDVLVDIADLFAVSTDWLTGRSNTPYFDETIYQLEEQHIQRLNLAINKDEILRNWGYNYVKENPFYLNRDTRLEHFSLPVRANFIFIFNILQAPPKKADLNQLKKFLISTIDNTTIPLFDINII